MKLNEMIVHSLETTKLMVIWTPKIAICLIVSIDLLINQDTCLLYLKNSKYDMMLIPSRICIGPK
jgi:hypothetical protein